MAVSLLNEKRVQRIILARPAVEAGEKLGFLPGDIAAKVDPYLRPLYDALYDMLEPERVERLLERGTIEVAPLAFMRGRTLNDSFIILDEAQNTTPEQMKMFLTRIGFDSKAVVTGDVTQIDLPAAKQSGLVEAREVVAGHPRHRHRALRRHRRRPPPAGAADHPGLRPPHRATARSGRGPHAVNDEPPSSGPRFPALARGRNALMRSATRILGADRWWSLAFVLVALLLFVDISPPPAAGLHAGDLAPGDLLAPRDLQLPDESQTEALRTEARATVPPVYLYDRIQGDRLAADLAKLLERGRRGEESDLLPAAVLAALKDGATASAVADTLDRRRAPRHEPEGGEQPRPPGHGAGDPAA